MVTYPITEVIFVGLPGPTHHYGGLSADNIASSSNRGAISNPLQAALQVVDLMRLLTSLGIATAVLPPQFRPHFALLRQHFSGDDESVLKQALQQAPALLEKASSASNMWVANAATVAPAIDCADMKLHISTANLFSNLHRRIEAEDTYKVLRSIFEKAPDCIVHPPLSPAIGMYDEGAANHMRLAPGPSAKGLHIFVYGADGSRRDPQSARQTLSASRALCAQHRIAQEQALFLRQNPDVIRAGVFHNDVIAVSNDHVLLVHQNAYDNGNDDIERIAHAYRQLHPGLEPKIIVIREEDLSVEEAVQCYFFNSQIITKLDGGMTIIAPAEVKLLFEGKAFALMEKICADVSNPINEIRIIDLRQSMRNGGGPACLRLRVPMGQAQLQAVSQHSGVMVDEPKLVALTKIIEQHYPHELTAQDLGNIELYHRSQTVMAELSTLLKI